MEFKLKVVKLYNEGEGGLRILAKNYGITIKLIRIWLKKYKNGEVTEEKTDKRGKCGYTKATFLNKEEKWDYLRLENEYLKKIADKGKIKDLHCKFMVIKKYEVKLSITKRCRILEINRGGYYKWLNKKPEKMTSILRRK